MTLLFAETLMIWGIGTAFFYRRGDADYLVTNWHNVTGRDPSDGKPIHKDAALPDNLLVRIPFQRTRDDGGNAIQWVPNEFDLYEASDNAVPVWLVHPKYGNSVDVVAIKVDDTAQTNIVAANSEWLDLDRLVLIPGMDVFVLGYPRGICGGGRFPLWKRGCIASEPDVDLDDLPKIYIDTATREGMSGSPVYAQETGYWAPEEKQLPDGAVLGRGNRFVGIYSGRIGNDPFSAQLGIVWKETAILEIIDGGEVGASSF